MHTNSQNEKCSEFSCTFLLRASYRQEIHEALEPCIMLELLDVDGQNLQTFCRKGKQWWWTSAFHSLGLLWWADFANLMQRKKWPWTSAFHSLGQLCLDVDVQILQTLCKGKNGHERARSTHSVSYAWMWMCRFCKPYAKEQNEWWTSILFLLLSMYLWFFPLLLACMFEIFLFLC